MNNKMNKSKDIKSDSDLHDPLPAHSEMIIDFDDVDVKRMETIQTIVIGGTVNNEQQIQDLKKEGLQIQEKYKKWIFKTVFDHYDVKIPNLIFDSQSPWLAEDKKQIFFRVIDVRSKTKFIVAADLDEEKHITSYYVGIE